MVESLNLALEHLLLGVGRGMFSSYMEKRLEPLPIAQSDPELVEWRIRGTIPKPSMLPGVMVEYGVILLAGLLWIVISIGVGLYRSTRSAGSDTFRKQVFGIYLAWGVLAFVSSFGLTDMRNPLFNSIFFMAVAFVRNSDVRRKVGAFP